jgi:hypothetical protein
LGFDAQKRVSQVCLYKSNIHLAHNLLILVIVIVLCVYKKDLPIILPSCGPSLRKHQAAQQEEGAAEHECKALKVCKIPAALRVIFHAAVPMMIAEP